MISRSKEAQDARRQQKLRSEQLMGLSDAHLMRISDVSDQVSETEEDTNNTQHFLQAHVASAFLAMQKAALNVDIDLQICSSFRSFDRQLSIWNRKWQGELPVLNRCSVELEPRNLQDEELIHAIMLWSALPGASRHHWGTDFDVYDKRTVTHRCNHFRLVPEEYEGNGPCADLNKWLDEHASEFGFYRPYATYNGGVAAEPWHFSYRDTARNIEQSFKVDALYQQLMAADICGKTAILKILPLLFERYTLNKGIIEI